MRLIQRVQRLGFAALAVTAMLAASGQTAVAQDRPVRGGKMVATVLELPQSLDPLLGNSASIDPLTLNLIYDTLVVWGLDGKYQPGLADSWSFSADGKALTLNLHPGVKFHDGTPFNAAAVVFNLERAISEKTNSPYRPQVSVIDGVEAVSELVARIKLKSPSGQMPYLLGFHPRRSLVVVCAEAGTSAVPMVMRMDLPPDDARALLGPDALIGLTTGTLENQLVRHRINATGAYSFREGVLKGLRLNAGVNPTALARRFATPLPAQVDGLFADLIAEGLMEADGETVRLTGEGRLRADAVGVAILECFD